MDTRNQKAETHKIKMRVIMKFGGDSLKNSERIAKVAEFVKREYARGTEVIVVVSAMGGVTNKLLQLAKDALSTPDTEKIEDELAAIEEHHVFEAQKIIKDPAVLAQTTADLREVIAYVRRILIGINSLREASPRSTDQVASAGERLSLPIVAGALQSSGVKAGKFTGWDIGIVTDSNFTHANPVMDVTLKNIKNVLTPILQKKIIPVITGYIAANEEGVYTTLGRGGSDYTATMVGLAMDADEIWLCKSVDGIMTTNPDIVPEAKTVKTISYREAAEIAYFGAKVLNPRCIEPAIEKGIKIRVRNTFKPEQKGTIIVPNASSKADVVKIVSVAENVALVNVFGVGMIGAVGLAAKVFETLAHAGVNIVMISQGSSQVNISIVVAKDHLKRAMHALHSAFSKDERVKSIESDEEIAVIAAVGAGMQTGIGVAARVFGAVARAGISLEAITTGAKEISISFIVKSKYGHDAVRAIHKEFKLHEA